MKTTGLTHLTAVSGANCAIVLGMVWLLLRMFGIGRGVRTVASLLVLTGYVVLVGWQPSVLRSAFMMGIVFISLELGKRVWIPGVLIIGSLTLLVVDPWLTFEYGFWLSVLATFGLVILTPKLSEKFQRQLPKWLAVTLAATLSAQLWCLPLLVELQGGFSTHSILANLLVEPAVPIITVLGLLAAISGPIVPLVGGFMLHLAAVPAGWIVWVANSLAQAPIELLPISGNLVGFILTALFSTFVTLAIKKGKMRFALVPLSLSALWLGSLCVQAVKQIGFNLSDWSVLSCDVGQGDATLLRSSNQLALIDVGRDPMLIDGCLDQQGIQSIDLLVLTHFDQDHVGGLPGLLNGRSISRVLISRFPDERPDALALIAELRNLNLELISAPEGLTGKLGNFTWEVISSLGNEGESANEASLGIKFESSALVIYTLADMNERAQERILRKASGSSKPTLVKVSHHGSADQCSEFYDRIDADVALISVGKGNSYGHPTKSALNMLAKTSTRVFRTDLQGAIAVKVSDGVIEVKTSGAR
jgi:competence protein ComEC